MRPRSLLHPFAVMKMACRDALCDARMVFRDATETGLTPSAFLVASCKMSKSNPAQHAATKIQTNIATTVGGKTTANEPMFPQPYHVRKQFLTWRGSTSERKVVAAMEPGRQLRRGVNHRAIPAACPAGCLSQVPGAVPNEAILAKTPALPARF